MNASSKKFLALSIVIHSSIGLAVFLANNTAPPPTFVFVTPAPIEFNQEKTSGLAKVPKLTEPSYIVPGKLGGEGAVHHSGAVTLDARNVLESGNVLPVYPVEAARHRWQGSVLIDLLMSPNGEVKAVQLKESSGYAVLDAASLEAARNWKFSSGWLAKNRVLKIEVPLDFVLPRN